MVAMMMAEVAVAALVGPPSLSLLPLPSGSDDGSPCKAGGAPTGCAPPPLRCLPLAAAVTGSTGEARQNGRRRRRQQRKRQRQVAAAVATAAALVAATWPCTAAAARGGGDAVAAAAAAAAAPRRGLLPGIVRWQRSTILPMLLSVLRTDTVPLAPMSDCVPHAPAFTSSSSHHSRCARPPRPPPIPVSPAPARPSLSGQ